MKNKPTGKPTLVGLPFNAQSSYLRGAAAAPSEIRQALNCAASNHWTELGVDLGGAGTLVDLGGICLRDRDAFESIESKIVSLLGEKRRLVILGGDHSIPYPSIQS